MNDTRKDGRLPVSLVARYREPTMLEPREGECRDLSPSGMFITTNRPSPRGALIRFECVTERAEDSFRGTGRVVWQRAKADARGPAGMGVRFVRLEAGGREALQRTLDLVDSDRRAGRVPRPSSVNPPVSRARIEEAMTQPVPIFAAGAGASSSHPPAASSSSVPAARVQQLRSATLRGVGIPDEVKSGSSSSAAPRNDPDRTPAPGRSDSDRPQITAAPTTPIPPRADDEPDGTASRSAKGDSDRAAARSGSGRNGGAPEDIRERLDRTRRGVPPDPNEVRERSAESNSDRPARGDATGRTQTARPGASDGERGGSEPTSDRPPGPGSTDDLRLRGGHSEDQGHDFSRTTLKEVAASTRGDVPMLRDPLRDPNDDNGGLGRDNTERRLPLGQDRTLPRVYRASDPPRTTSRGLMWIVLGGGFAASLAVVRLFGTVPFGIPDGAPAPEKSQPSSAAAAEAAANADEVIARPYVLEVVTEPAGARVSANGQSVTAPGELRFDRFQPPLLVTATLAGYPNATASVWPSHFTQKDDRYAGHLELRFEGAPKNAPQAAASNAPAAQQERESAKSHDSSRGSKSSRTAPRTPSRVPSAPPPPSEPPAPVVSVTPAEPPPSPAHDEPEPPAERTPPQQPPLAQALDCLARGDNRCVIRALEDKASSAREMELLIETYRAVGSTPRAERQMQRYLQRYPSGQRADEYRQVLEHRASTPTPAPAP